MIPEDEIVEVRDTVSYCIDCRAPIHTIVTPHPTRHSAPRGCLDGDSWLQFKKVLSCRCHKKEKQYFLILKYQEQLFVCSNCNAKYSPQIVEEIGVYKYPKRLSWQELFVELAVDIHNRETGRPRDVKLSPKEELGSCYVCKVEFNKLIKDYSLEYY